MAYNEAATLAATVGEIAAAVPDADILVIDDGSTDDTAAVTANLTNVRIIRFPTNRGLGAVYRTGFAEATDLLTFWPADGQFPASIISDFLPRMADVDLILGTIAAQSTLSTIERMIYRVLFGPMPSFQGVMMARVQKLRKLTLTSEGRGWTIVMELVIRAQRAGWRIVSVPTPFRPRQHGRSKVRNLRTILSHMNQLVALRRTID